MFGLVKALAFTGDRHTLLERVKIMSCAGLTSTKIAATDAEVEKLPDCQSVAADISDFSSKLVAVLLWHALLLFDL